MRKSCQNCTQFGGEEEETQYTLYVHYHHISFMELGHLLTRSGLTYPEVSSKVYHDSYTVSYCR